VGNAFLATKVASVNQSYDLAKEFGLSFKLFCELGLLGERVGQS
jgi:UDP-glucose 6-dehydrogenase